MLHAPHQVCLVNPAHLADNPIGSVSAARSFSAEAEPLYQRALAIREKALGPEQPDVADVLENYASLMRKIGNDAEAEKLEARAATIRAKYSPSPPLQEESTE